MKKIVLALSLLLVGSISNTALAGQTTFKWHGYSTMLGGSCYEVDVETGGDQFREYADESDCRPYDHFIRYVTKDGSCFEVDGRNPDDYSVKVDSSKCGY